MNVPDRRSLVHVAGVALVDSIGGAAHENGWLAPPGGKLAVVKVTDWGDGNYSATYTVNGDPSQPVPKQEPDIDHDAGWLIVALPTPTATAKLTLTGPGKTVTYDLVKGVVQPG